MSKHTITAFVMYEKPWVDGQEAFKVYPFDMSGADRVLIGQQQVEIEVPDNFNPVPGQIAALEKLKADVRAKAARELMTLDERISKLQAIEYEPATEPRKCENCDGRGKVAAEDDVDNSGDSRGFPCMATCGECNGEGSTS